MIKRDWVRYWVYYTCADIIGLFTGIVIYGLAIFPIEYVDFFRLSPDTIQLASTTGSVFYFWYLKAYYLPILLVSFLLFLLSINKTDTSRYISEYITVHRLMILILYLGVIPSFNAIENSYQFLIPVLSIIFFNALAFYLYESRVRFDLEKQNYAIALTQ